MRAIAWARHGPPNALQLREAEESAPKLNLPVTYASSPSAWEGRWKDYPQQPTGSGRPLTRRKEFRIPGGVESCLDDE